MRRTLRRSSSAVVWVMSMALPNAQEPPAVNPLAGNDAAIQSGMGLFRSRCADCHGMDARGVRGPDLTQVWASGRTDGASSARCAAVCPAPRCRQSAHARQTMRCGRSSPISRRSRHPPRPPWSPAMPHTASRCSCAVRGVPSRQRHGRTPWPRSLTHRRVTCASCAGQPDPWRHGRLSQRL